jgi:hypothetical protein
MEQMSGERTCSACGASLQDGQDWCLQCGAGAPGSGRMGPGWRSAAVLIGATGALVLGAAAAAYAALDQSSPAKPKTPVVAQTPTTITTTTSSTATAPPSTTPSPTPAPGAIVKSPSLNTPSTPPKIPGSTATPKSKTTATNTKSSSTTTTSTSSTSSATQQTGGEQPVAVLLDTNAAQIYNPSNLPASRFGDPSLAIDGDTTTAWTVKLEGSVAPTVDAGLTLDLKAPLKIAQITLITESAGMTVQVYGTKGAKIPQALSSEEWVHLSKAHVVKKRKANITLSEDKKAFRQLLVWISKAPTSSGGQFSASEVSIDEIQLYEPSSSGSQG